MRAKVVLPVFVLSALLIAFAFVMHQRAADVSDAPPATPPTEPVAAPQPQSPSQPIRAKAISPPPEIQPASSASVSDPMADDHKTAVANRIAELNRLAMTSDPHSLDTILSELSNRDHQIRMAAISATIDFGSRDAIPALQNAMGWTDDLKEKVEIQRAIDFLQLPPALAQEPKAPQ